MWTPLLRSFLEDPNGDLPFGLIFATFMVCCMTGSSIFSILVEKYPVEKLAVGIFMVASVAMAIVAMEINETMSFLGMNLFEMTVGMYFPGKFDWCSSSYPETLNCVHQTNKKSANKTSSQQPFCLSVSYAKLVILRVVMGTMKGGIVPEDKRAAIYNLYRIPLNFIVLFSLLTDLTPRFSFMLNATMLATATVLQAMLTKKRLETTGRQETKSTDDVEQAIPLVSNKEESDD